MQRRCTQRSCRREFRVGSSSPVRCPHCGTVYPRVRPDLRAPGPYSGYCVRVDLTGLPQSEWPEIRRVFPRHRAWPSMFGRMPAAIRVHLSEAGAVCRLFRQQGIPAALITAAEAAQQRLYFFRPVR